MICPNCNKENKNTNIRCEYCSTELIDINKFNNLEDLTPNDIVMGAKSAKYLKLGIGCLSIMFLGLWLLVGLGFLGMGLYCTISEHNQTKEYESTTGVLKGYTNCSYSDGSKLCNATYEYEVDGIRYTASPSKFSNRSSFEKNKIVYYNPNNPSESIIYADWNIIIITGLIFIVVVVIISIIIINFTKKIPKDEKNYTTKIYNNNN
ncbi:MAG: DUF3592 domain-containing protein [Candidatus Coprovivens sp.]